MPQKISALLLLMPCFFLAFAWQQVTIDQKVSVAFPEKPQKTLIDGKQTWIADIDSTARLMVMVTDFGKLGVDAATLGEMLKKKKTYTDLKNGFLLGSETAVALGDSISTFKGKPAYFLKMDMKGEKGEFNKVQLVNVFIGTKMYALTLMEQYHTEHETLKLKFWNSLLIEKKIK